MKVFIAALLTFGAATAGFAQSAPAQPDSRFTLPGTVSPAAAAELKMIFGLWRGGKAPAKPSGPADWKASYDQLETMIEPFVAATVKPLGIIETPDRLGDVPVLRLRPARYKTGTAPLIYVHGGGYVSFSAKTSRLTGALLAAASGREVISIDYTVAPQGNWRTATDQVLAVWKALIAAGAKPATIGMFGDSAGGGLVAGSVLKMRDQGLPLPGALLLLSPWSDITATGDTYTTLAAADPSLNTESLSWGADVYAAPADQKNPYVSPVYGDYSKAFPPTLIQGGTREIFLSNFVRHYQAIRSGGHEAVLDIYEGMPHVFQTLASHSPESRLAVARAVAFFDAHLAHTK
ncbi:alpha/beta hydrolase fold domain-containing protein [Sphingomonas sp. ERG5]|uniref:alpha/beta hydrolase fold domain-containing protein n=1 Tax=Sphingomonas sp. ERG5 TaxID=1381597 RepID=UPI00068F912D|nr:alpha/beta hydrolase [Sphingomonas sp. ERG5]